MDTVSEVSVSVSPVWTVFDAVSAIEYRNVPAVDASHTLMYVSVSGDVPAHDVHDGNVAIAAIEPDAAAPNVSAGRVVTDEGALVAADPGSAVWSLTKLPAGAVDACALCMWSKTLLT